MTIKESNESTSPLAAIVPLAALGLEVMRISEHCRRRGAEQCALPQRVAYFMMIAVTEGETVHRVDYVDVPAEPGTWLFLRPGQMQPFDFSRSWDGWVLTFRPDFLPMIERNHESPYYVMTRRMEGLRSAIRLAPAEHAICCATAEQMLSDYARDVDVAFRAALMLSQVCELLTRLILAHCLAASAGPDLKADPDRVARFRVLVDEQFRTRHNLAWYGSRLGCSLKTLSRATLAVTGKTAKALVSERIILEAKRMLTYGHQPVQGIADELGFDDTSNFVKFFRKEAGCTPTVFREQRYGADAELKPKAG